jgi:uncharacterized protein
LAKDVILELSDSFIATCDDGKVPYSAGMTTNAYLLNSEVAQSLLERKVRRFQITLDGPEETHNLRRHKVNGKGTYEQILENLIALRDLNDRYVVRLRVNFDPASINQIEPWLKEIAPLFANDERFAISFHPIGKWGGPNDGKLNVCSDELSRDAKLSLFENAFDLGFSRLTYRDFLSSHGSSCYAGKASSVVVGSDGQLYKCTVAFDDERNKVGKLIPGGEMVIDQSKWKLWVDTSSLEVKKCSSCWFHASCESRTCPLVALDHGEPPCPSNQNEMKNIVELSVYGHRVPDLAMHSD